jgi:hypothetical protein
MAYGFYPEKDTQGDLELLTIALLETQKNLEPLLTMK